MRLFELSEAFPKSEVSPLTDQWRRSDRSVCANLAEAWHTRRYPAVFVSKLYDSKAEAAETQTWLDFSVRCGYIAEAEGVELRSGYEAVLRTLGGMIAYADEWTTR